MRTQLTRSLVLSALLVAAAGALTACNSNDDRSYADNTVRTSTTERSYTEDGRTYYRSSDTNHLSPTFGPGGDGGESYNWGTPANSNAVWPWQWSAPRLDR